MTDSQLADHEEEAAPYCILENGVFELWTEFDGSRVWWQNRETRELSPVWCYWLCEAAPGAERERDYHRAWKLLDLAECSPQFDNTAFPEAPSLDMVREAFDAQRITLDPRMDMKHKIYCYLKPTTAEGPWVGEATADDGTLILTHESLTEADVKPALGFDTNWNHDKYNAKYGRGNWELFWLSTVTLHPAYRQPPAQELAMT